MIKEDLYLKLNLLPPEEYAELDRQSRVSSSFKILKKYANINGLNSLASLNMEMEQKILYRRTGKTTNSIIEMLFRFYQGWHVAVLCTNTNMVRYTTAVTQDFRKVLDPEYFYPPMCGNYEVIRKTIFEYNLRNTFSKTHILDQYDFNPHMLGKKFDLIIDDSD
jgi:hypothetical protein